MEADIAQKDQALSDLKKVLRKITEGGEKTEKYTEDLKEQVSKTIVCVIC